MIKIGLGTISLVTMGLGISLPRWGILQIVRPVEITFVDTTPETAVVDSTLVFVETTPQVNIKIGKEVKFI